MAGTAGSASLRRSLRLLLLSLARLQRELAEALGLTEESRTNTVVAMLASNARRAPGYWIQLTLAMGIATLGLVLGSTAVVIGAMLVSPLMGPIIELGMGFAVGSSLLVIRSFLRVVLSVLWVVIAAAGFTLLLPFHEVTTEIAARTAPTALDLLVAAFCALTAAYTTARAASDTTAAAAGTAIGIALVPPLCVTGYGLGTGSLAIASGAGLLFTANFSAIVVLAALSFVLLGYNEVDAESLEQEILAADESRTERIAERAHRRLRALFGSRYGRYMRFVVPVLFLIGVYVPLSRALDEVAWQVRVRNGIDRMLADQRMRVVQTALSVERHTVSLRLLLLGTPDQAATLERRLLTRIAAVAGVEPSVQVLAVPDAGTLASLSAQTRGNATSPDAPPAPVLDLAALRRRVGGALGAEWPAAAAGPLLGWSLEVADEGDPRLRLLHLGAPLGAAADAILGNRIGAAVQGRVTVTSQSLATDTVTAAAGGGTAWLPRALALATPVATTPALRLCVEAPATVAGRRAQQELAATRSALDTSPAARAGRVVVREGTRWRAWLAAREGGCGG